MTNLTDGHIVIIDYTNYRGERDNSRLIKPIRIEFGSNEWHPEPQYLLYAFDLAKNDVRHFAMASIHSWKPGNIYSSDLIARLREALENAAAWHASQDKALSKSGRDDADYYWRREQHLQQIKSIEAAIAIAMNEPPTPDQSSEGV